MHRLPVVVLLLLTLLGGVASCAPPLDDPPWPPRSADMSGLEPWMRPLMVEAAAWWGNELRHEAFSDHKIAVGDVTSLSSNFTYAGTFAGAHVQDGDAMIIFSDRLDVMGTFWADCRRSESGTNFRDAAIHEWGHIRGEPHSDDLSSYMNQPRGCASNINR